MVFSTLATNGLEYLELPTQIASSEDYSVNHALVYVAQSVLETLQRAYSIPIDDINHTQTISIRATELEYRHLMFIDPLSIRKLEVLQLIVEGDKNSIIAQKLYITEGTVKTHVSNILRKLCATDRTQAAIRALRSTLVHQQSADSHKRRLPMPYVTVGKENSGMASARLDSGQR